MRIFIEDQAGNRYECDVPSDTPLNTIAVDFFEANNWNQQGRAVVELVDEEDSSVAQRLKGGQTISQANIQDGSVVRIFRESIAAPSSNEMLEKSNYFDKKIERRSQNLSEDLKKALEDNIDKKYIRALIDNLELVERIVNEGRTDNPIIKIKIAYREKFEFKVSKDALLSDVIADFLAFRAIKIDINKLLIEHYSQNSPSLCIIRNLPYMIGDLDIIDGDELKLIDPNSSPPNKTEELNKKELRSWLTKNKIKKVLDVLYEFGSQEKEVTLLLSRYHEYNKPSNKASKTEEALMLEWHKIISGILELIELI